MPSETRASSTKSIVSTKAPRLNDAEEWLEWSQWVTGQVWLLKLHAEWKADGDAGALGQIYGIIATSVTGKAARTLHAAKVVGDGYKAFNVLQEDYGGQRSLQAVRHLMEALTKKQPDDQSAIDFCTEKRELFTLVEDKFNNDTKKLYAFIRGVSMVANLNNPSAVEHLIMYLSEKEQKNEVPKLEDLENKIRTFGDAADLRRGNEAPKNLALSATDKDDKADKADNKGKKKKGGRGRGGGRGKGRGRGGGRGNWGGNYYQGGFQGYGSGRGNGAKGFGQWWWSNPKKKQGTGNGKGKGKGWVGLGWVGYYSHEVL